MRAERKPGWIFPWVVCTLALGFAILIGICGGQAAFERDDLLEENKGLLRDAAELRLEIDAIKIDTLKSRGLKNLRINMLEVEVETYQRTYGDLPYDYGYIPE